MKALGKGERFLALHDRPGMFVMPNPYDAGTARMIERAGFVALATSTAALAFSRGVPDGQVPIHAMIEHIGEIAQATDLPVHADLGDGFGVAPEIVAETIKLAAAAGAVGGSIEDATGDPAQPLFDLSLATERVLAAVEAARSLGSPFILTARAENFLAGAPDLDDALRRLEAYREAGADVLYAPCLPDESAVAAVVALAGSTPVNVLALGVGPTSDLPRMHELGVRRVSLGSALSRGALTLVDRALNDLAAGKVGFLTDCLSLSELNRRFASEPTGSAA